MTKTLCGVAAAAVLGLGALLGTGSARAGDYYYNYQYNQSYCEYKTVIVYETRVVPYTQTVTQYDDYGCPYQTQVTYYQKVQVAVKKLVKVCY